MFLNYVPVCVDGMKVISGHETIFGNLAASGYTSEQFFFSQKN